MAERAVRLSQTLSPFGVGAIYDVLGESFVACDTTLWKHHGRTLRAPRLERALGVASLREAPSVASVFGRPNAPGVPYFRFPRWLFCASCRLMTFWSPRREMPGEPPRCLSSSCHSPRALVPMRFVMVCREGHLTDVPWQRWAHAGADLPAQKRCEDSALEFVARPSAGSGLASLLVRCRTCQASSSLAGISSPGSMKRFGITCRGLQPWQVLRDLAAHDETPEVVQRGASNVHFATVESAIDIPPESRHAQFSEITLRVTGHPYFQAIMSNPTNPVVDGLIAGIALELEVDEREIRAVIDAEVARQAGSGHAVPLGSPDDLQAAEWTAFVTPLTEADDRDKFITRHVTVDTSSMGPRQAHVVKTLLGSFDRIVLATRLREVRALTGFSRLDPGETLVRPDLGRGLTWLPAIEVFGEGVFLSLQEDRVASWEEGAAASRVEILSQRRAASFMSRRLPQASPRLVLLHTLAHLLIRQLAFESGYASASLRERIYFRGALAGDPQAGILIYTAAGDSEGTLGGLVRQGEPERLAPSLLALLQRALWCSNDPICRDSPGQGIDGLNRGACHACVLISETSCVMNNVMLDRSLVVGATEPGVSLFDSCLRLAIAGGPDGS